eukprot:m.125908 g.125908  ORF g.125908 m.125908 type:complete len:451 (+) comp12986_c0_seq4:39-1391(+)
MPPRVTPTTTKRRKTKNAAAAKKKGAVNGWGSSKLGGGQYQPQPQQTSSSPSSSSSSSTIGTKSTKKKKKSSGKSSKSQQTDVVKGVVSKSSLDAMVGLSKPATPSATTTPALSPAQSPSSTRRKKRTTETDRKRNAPGLIDEKDGSSPVAKRKKKKGVNKDKSTAETHFYTSEITHLMESVGRFDHIQYDANLLIEDIFRQYILNVAKESERIAMLRGHTEILVEDICFSVRSHPHLMKRIVTFFAYKQHGLTSKTSAITAEKVAVQMPQFEFMNTLMSDCPTLSLPKLLWKQERSRVSSKEHVNIPTEPSVSTSAALRPELDISKLVPTSCGVVFSKSTPQQTISSFATAKKTSFTYKKAKKFRKWLQLTLRLQLRITEATQDIFGFIASEGIKRFAEVTQHVTEEQRRAHGGHPVSVSTDVVCEVYRRIQRDASFGSLFSSANLGIL